jgi:hypothetical protein
VYVEAKSRSRPPCPSSRPPPLQLSTFFGSSSRMPWPRSSRSILPPSGTPPKTSSIPEGREIAGQDQRGVLYGEGAAIRPFQPVQEKWNPVTFLNQTAPGSRGPDVGGSRKASCLLAWNGLTPKHARVQIKPPPPSPLLHLAPFLFLFPRRPLPSPSRPAASPCIHLSFFFIIGASVRVKLKNHPLLFEKQFCFQKSTHAPLWRLFHLPKSSQTARS